MNQSPQKEASAIYARTERASVGGKNEVDRIVVFRRGRIVANLDVKDTDGDVKDTDGQDVVAYIMGAKTGAESEGAA